MDRIDHLFIVGAGFSTHAGLPLTNQFTERLLDVHRLKLDGPSNRIVRFLKEFVEISFGHKPNSAKTERPDLEDLFTCIDLSANTGHHLGPKFPPSYLRTVRRALIVRIIRMLYQAYNTKQKKIDENWRRLEDFLYSVDTHKCAFLSMNWDTVIEMGIKRTRRILPSDYGCNAKFIQVDENAKKLFLQPSDDDLVILKPHGSSNWLYCDACRQVFWVSPHKTEWVANLLFKKADWKIVGEFVRPRVWRTNRVYECPNCSADALGTRFATFSYRKALDFSMYERSWDAAERYLQLPELGYLLGTHSQRRITNSNFC